MMSDSASFEFADSFVIGGVELRLTCGACPEQYEAYQEGQQIGYLRLRHGYFSVDYPDCGGDEVYTARPEGDGVFSGGGEREYHLRRAVAELKRFQNREPTP